jgi:hypothetical protein
MLTKQKKTHVIFCMDISGSMGSVRGETIGMYNSQIETLRKEREGLGDVFCSLVYFGLNPHYHNDDTKVIEVVYQGVALDQLAQMTEDDYMPQGMTPMRDGIGTALGIGEALELGEQDAVLLIVLTDGQENNSREFTAKQLADKIATLRATGKWTIQVMGANIDLSDVAHFGIQGGEFSRFNGTGQSVNAKSVAVSGYLTSYSMTRGMGETRSLDTIEDVD